MCILKKTAGSPRISTDPSIPPTPPRGSLQPLLSPDINQTERVNLAHHYLHQISQQRPQTAQTLSLPCTLSVATTMDRPPLPPPPQFTAGFPSASLIDSLIQICNEIATPSDNSPVRRQSRNLAAAVRRIKLLSSLFEEIRYSTTPLPPSSVLCLTELLSVIRHTKSLIDGFAGRSSLWNLLQSERVAQQFHSCAKEMSRALDILPLSLLDVPSDVREQVELLHRQAKRADLYVDPRELWLRDELFQLMALDREYVDCKKLEEIMRRAGLRSESDYQEEISSLSAELKEQAGTGGLVAISNLNSLMSLVSYSESAVFRSGTTGDQQRRPPNSTRRALNRSLSWSVSSSPSFNSMVMNIPDEFRCPISLDLMGDPVIVASGHTYDRASIARWINSGHHTCPKSGQRLIHRALIPNYSVKSLIGQWCKENHVPSSFWDSRDNATVSATHQAVDHISAVKSASEAVRMTAEFLVGKLAMGSADIQRQAAYELRLLAKTGMDNRRVIAEAGAIPFLVTLLSSRDARAQENAVTALLNLSIFNNNKILIMAAGAINAIIEVLTSGAAMEARENAAATIFSLSMIDECKVAIGAKLGAMSGLVSLLKEGTAVGKRDAATALFNLAMYNANRAAVVAAGAVTVLVELLMDEKAAITDDVLAVLALLCGCREGMMEIAGNQKVVPMLLDLLRFGSPKGKENAISVLLGLCRDGGEEMGRRLLVNPRSVPSLQSLAATGSPRARRKADALLRLLMRVCSQCNAGSV